VCLGIVGGYFINMAFENVDQGWRYMFGYTVTPPLFYRCLLPVYMSTRVSEPLANLLVKLSMGGVPLVLLLLLSVFRMPESPSWLVSQVPFRFRFLASVRFHWHWLVPQL